MVEKQLRARGITDAKVLDAFLKVERHIFVEESLWDRGYDDCPLPIGKNQTISQPYMVAIMTQTLQLKGDERVLEIGTGSGYQTSILANLVQQVFTIERHAELAKKSRKVFEAQGLHNVAMRIGDGSIGWKEFAPYDRIIVTAGSPKEPRTLFNQLYENKGKLVAPVGGEKMQDLFRYERNGDEIVEKFICNCSFVPLIGMDGWSAVK